MKPERWREIERLYHAARERTPEQRPAFLQRASAGDEALRATVESLLARREEAGDFMEPPPRQLEAPSAATPIPADPCFDEPEQPRGFVRRLPWWVWCCALPALISAAALYWILLTTPAPLGWVLTTADDDPSGTTRRVRRVGSYSAAERAGLQTDDLLSGVEAERFVRRPWPYAPDKLEVVRAGERKMLTVAAGRRDFRYWAGREGRRPLTFTAISALSFALAGMLLFRRPHDRGARWGALLVTQLGFVLLFMAIGPWPGAAPDVAHAVRTLPLPAGIIVLLTMAISIMIPAGAFGFCSVFPRPLALARRRWWPAIFLFGPVATVAIDLKAFWLPVYGSSARIKIPSFAPAAGYLLGVISVIASLFLLAHNYRSVGTLNERRRLRIVALGFGLTLTAITAAMVLTTPWRPLQEFYDRRWQGSSWQLLQFSWYAAAPVCLSYAILRHRIFDIHIIIRLGLRYATARGILLSIVPITGLALMSDLLSHRHQPLSEVLAGRGLAYAVLAAAALLLHVKRKSWMDALDRRFFRERYDAYRLLSGVMDDVRRASSFEEAARRVVDRIDAALHPEAASLMIRRPGDSAYQPVAAIHESVPEFPGDATVIALARVLNKPLENAQSGTGWLAAQLPRGEVNLLRRARMEWLFPVVLGGYGAEAFLLVGPKRSEEPYSREDRMMIGASTASLALLLERPSFVSSRRVLAGRYRLDRRLGGGGMGSVYEATDTVLERRVAVKMTRDDWIASADAVARFRREAKAAASFTHPNVVTVYDFGVSDDDRAYLVMELLEGDTLREELREQGTLEPNRALQILRGITSAVATAHERRLLHRDLKPENIFLARSEAGEVAKVLDFGLVKPLEPESAALLTSTAPGALVGTVAYMSPEQRSGERPTESWDIWALTVIAFEMLTGVHPFAASAGAQVARGGASNIGSLGRAATLSAPLASFFEHALAIDRSRRPASAHQLMEELESAV